MPRNGQWTPDKVRARIRVGMIVTRLQNHVEGKIELTQTQVSAGLGLLKKVLADQTEITGEIKHQHAITSKPLTADEFQRQLEDGSYSVGAPARTPALSS